MADLTTEQEDAIWEARMHGSYRCKEHLIRAVQRVVDAHVAVAMSGGALKWLTADRADQFAAGEKAERDRKMREDRDAAPAAPDADLAVKVRELAEEWEEWAGKHLFNLDSEHRSVAKMTMVYVHALRALVGDQ